MNSYKLFYFIQIILGIITIYISSLLLTSIAINRQKCKEASLRDSLTGLYDNREFFKEEIHRITNHSARAGGKTALLFADIDKFKDINAIFTHKGGDDILKSAAEILRDSTKRRDFVGRFGGDEFIIVFAFNDEKEIDTYIDRINSAFKSAHIFVASKRAKITLTFGVEIVDSETDIDKLFEAASEKMLAAKG